MVYSEKKLVHEVPPCAKTDYMSSALSGHEVTVMRLRANRENLPMQPVLDVAKGFVDREEPYPMSTIYLVGMIFLLFGEVVVNQKALIEM